MDIQILKAELVLFTGTSWERCGTPGKLEEKHGPPGSAADHWGLPGDTVYSVTTQLGCSSSSKIDGTEMNQEPWLPSSHIFPSSILIPRQGKMTSAADGASRQEVKPVVEAGLRLHPEPVAEPCSALPPASPLSPSPDAEYDKLLDVEAVPMPDGQTCLLALPPECSQGEGPEKMPYLKLFCRYITDCKGVVSGILLVTSNKIFFDPCKSNPLVTEHGCEEYLLSCSIDCLASVSFFSDISHVHFNSSTLRWKNKTVPEKPADEQKCPGSVPSHHGGASAAMLDPSTPLVPGRGRAGSEEEEDAESQDMAETERQLDDGTVECPAGTLGGTVLSSAATFCCVGQDEGRKVMAENVHAEDAEEGSCVKRQISVSHRQSSSSTGGLMFVRLRVQRTGTGTKKGRGGFQLGTSKTLPRRTAWLALSQESSDELYAYLSHWRPDLCILEGGAEEAEREADIEEFVLVDDREEEEEEEQEEEVSQRHRRSGEDWEIVSMEENGVKPPLVPDKDPEGLTEIVETSRILKASQVRELYAELPPRTVGYSWKLAYSTSRHGSSLKSLYRKLSGTDSPALIVIKDALDQVFGSFLSHPLKPSETFYGTGETFLFMLHPRFKCFRWTGENSFFIKGDLDSFAIGGGSGHFGLWLDETLYLGRSSPCYTFNNCCLSETDDFRVMELEVWTFC